MIYIPNENASIIRILKNNHYKATRTTHTITIKIHDSFVIFERENNCTIFSNNQKLVLSKNILKAHKENKKCEVVLHKFIRDSKITERYYNEEMNMEFAIRNSIMGSSFVLEDESDVDKKKNINNDFADEDCIFFGVFKVENDFKGGILIYEDSYKVIIKEMILANYKSVYVSDICDGVDEMILNVMKICKVI